MTSIKRVCFGLITAYECIVSSFSAHGTQRKRVRISGMSSSATRSAIFFLLFSPSPSSVGHASSQFVLFLRSKTADSKEQSKCTPLPITPSATLLPHTLFPSFFLLLPPSPLKSPPIQFIMPFSLSPSLSSFISLMNRYQLIL